MPDRSSESQGTKDVNEVAKSIIDRAADKPPETEDAPEEQPETTEDGKNRPPVRLAARRGAARARKLREKRRSEIAQKPAG